MLSVYFKLTDASADGKRLLLHMDTRNTGGVTSALPPLRGFGVPVASLTRRTQRKRCFTPVFCEAVASFQSSRLIIAEAWLSHDHLSIFVSMYGSIFHYY